METFSFGETEVRIYGGYRSIGGNCVVIESPSVSVMFDQGANFTQLKKFYGISIQPDSVEELRKMKVLPPREAYGTVDEVYVSHLHLDHLGSLNVPQSKKVYLPSRELVEVLSRTWWFGWKQHLFPQTLSFTGFSEIEESRKVHFAKVSHSAYPSYAFRVDTDDVSIIYTGDLRLASPYAGLVNTADNLRALSEGGVDVLIMEGTNFGRSMNYLTVQQFKALLRELLENYKHDLLFISTHPLDLETTLVILELLWEHGFTPVFTNNYYAKLLDTQIDEVGYEVGGELLYAPSKVSGAKILNNFETAYLSELRGSRIAVFVPAYGVKEMKDVLDMLSADSSGVIHITVFGEPLAEEWVVEEKKVANWLSLLGITSLRMHLSGHYLPFEFKEILDAIKPRKLIPIHTESPSTMLTLFGKYE